MMHIIFFSIIVFQGQWLCTSSVHLNAYLFHLPQNNMLNMFNIIKTSSSSSSSFPNLDITSSKETSELRTVLLYCLRLISSLYCRGCLSWHAQLQRDNLKTPKPIVIIRYLFSSNFPICHIGFYIQFPHGMSQHNFIQI